MGPVIAEDFDIYTDQIIPAAHEIITVLTSNSQFDSPKNIYINIH